MNAKRKNTPSSEDQYQGHGVIPPQAIELEKSILGAVLIDSRALPRVSAMIQEPGVFYKESHQVVYKHVLEMTAKDMQVDLITLVQYMKDSGALDRVGGAKFIAELSQQVSSSAHVQTHARIVLDKWMQREVIRASMDMYSAAYDADADVVDILTNHQRAFEELMVMGTKGKRPDLLHYVNKASEEIMALSKNEKGFSGIPTGFHELDVLTGGWRPGEMIVIGARPKMGKTALATAMVKAAVTAGYKGVFISGEMTETDMVKRMMALEAPTLHANQLFLHGLKKDIYMAEFYNDILPKVEAMNDKLRVMRQTGNIRPLKMELLSIQSEWGLDFVVLDYIQLYDVGGRQSNRAQEVSEVSRAVKNMALDLNVPIIALAQLSREVERRPNKRPMLSDLKESGSIEQDADKIIFIYRDEYYYKKESKLPGIAELIVEVQRNGAPGTVYTAFDSNKVRFVDDQRLHGQEYLEESPLVKQDWL